MEADKNSLGPIDYDSLNLDYHSELYFAPKAVDQSAANLLSVKKGDVLFTVLRHVVFRINHKSATAITQILREKLSDADIYDLVDEFSAATQQHHGHGAKWEWEAKWLQDEAGKTKTMQCPKLRAKMSAAREQHANNLKKYNLRDVDIIYTGEEAKLYKFKIDKAALSAGGGKPYHLWPFNAETKRIGMSIIVRPHVLDRVYPADRAGINIIDNTMVEYTIFDPPEPPHRGCIFPYLLPGHSKLESEQLAIEARENAQSEVKDLPNARSFPRVISKATNDTAIQPSKSSRLSVSLPESPTELLVLPGIDNSDDHRWWQVDCQIRRAIITDWDNKTTIAVGEGVHKRHLTDKSPAESVPGVDYELVPSLCQTYTSDRNFDWHRDNVEPEDAKEDAQNLVRTEAYFKKQLANTKQLYNIFRSAKEDVRCYPHNKKARAYYSDQMRNMFVAREDLEATKASIKQLRVKLGFSGKALDDGLHFSLNSVTDDRAKMQYPGNYQQPKPAQIVPADRVQTPHPEAFLEGLVAPVPYKADDSKEEHDEPTMRGALNDDETASRSSVLETAGSVISDEYDEPANDEAHQAAGEHEAQALEQEHIEIPSIRLNNEEETPTWSPVSATEDLISPFPEYVDPMAEEAIRFAKFDPVVQKLINEQRKGHLANLLRDTGVLTHRERLERLPSAETMVGSNEPLTPSDWMHARRESHFLNNEGGYAFSAPVEPEIADERSIVNEVEA